MQENTFSPSSSIPDDYCLFRYEFQSFLAINQTVDKGFTQTHLRCVDDCLLGCDNVPEVLELQQQINFRPVEPNYVRGHQPIAKFNLVSAFSSPQIQQIKSYDI